MSQLTQEQVREIFDYDAENGVLIRKFRNGCPYNKPTGHKPASHGYGQVQIDGKMYLTHRVIWLWHTGSWPEHEIDHIDRDPMNNRIENLRSITRSENMQNTGLHRDNSSGYPGVSFHKRTGKYEARIMVNNKQINLGLFNTTEEAYLAYQLAKIEYHPNSPIAQQYLREITLAA